MAKILLVEDDKSLREIYGVRLQAEGYEIVSAGDGEEALAMAIKERPELIISDVMMPKISGFDMLDILRSTTETKNVKVIMMTALSSDDQRARGEALGADRYLVKSQVGIEDVVRTVHDVLTDTPGSAPAEPSVFATGNNDTTPPSSDTVSAPQFTNDPATTTMPVATPDPIASMPDPIDMGSAMTPNAPSVPEPITASEPAAMPDPIASFPSPAPFTPQDPITPDPVVPMAPPQPVTPAPYTPPAPLVANDVPPVINMPPEVPVVSAPAPTAPLVSMNFDATPPVPAAPAATPLPAPTAPFSSPAPASLADRVIAPLSSADDIAKRPPNMADLMSQELQRADAPVTQTTPPPPPAPPVPPTPVQ